MTHALAGVGPTCLSQKVARGLSNLPTTAVNA